MSINGLTMNGSQDSSSSFEDLVRTQKKRTPEEEENLKRALASLRLEPTTNESFVLPDEENLNSSSEESKDSTRETDKQVTRLAQAFLKGMVIGSE